MNTSLAGGILRAGLLVGTLDWMAACLVFMIRGGGDPTRVFAYIASALMGPEAFGGQAWVPFFGLLLHYIIAYSWTTLFFIAYPRVLALRGSPWVVGIVYGAVVWLVMNLIVIPLSRIPPVTIKVTSAAIGMSVLMVCIGIPLAFRARRHYA